jgi:HlyD family secretion protein
MKQSILLLFVLIICFSCNKEGNGFDASGIFEGEETIISAEANGKIIELNIEEGTDLKAGQVIGKIDCTNLDLQKAQAEATIGALNLKQNDAAPQQEITREQIIVQQKQINTQLEQIRVLEKEKLRVEKLVKAEAAPAKQLDDIEGQLSILKKQYETAESQLGVLQRQLKSQAAVVGIQNRGIMSEKQPMEQRVAQLNDQLNRCLISNPVGGTVLTKYASANEVAAMGKPLYKIADLGTMTLRAYISGSDLGNIKLNQPVRVFVDQGAENYKEIPGNITWISSKAEFTPKTIQTKEERSNLVYAIKIKVKNDGYLKLGMFGEVKFK